MDKASAIESVGKISEVDSFSSSGESYRVGSISVAKIDKSQTDSAGKKSVGKKPSFIKMIATKPTDSMLDKNEELVNITEISGKDDPSSKLPPMPRKRSSPKRTLTQNKLSGSVADVVGEGGFGEEAGRNMVLTKGLKTA